MTSVLDRVLRDMQRQVRRDMERELRKLGISPRNYEAQRPACPAAMEVTAFGSPFPAYVCGCGRGCYSQPAPAPVCICGDSGTHRPEPGIGCTRPGCLCLEPAEPDRSWIQMERIRG